MKDESSSENVKWFRTQASGRIITDSSAIISSRQCPLFERRVCGSCIFSDPLGFVACPGSPLLYPNPPRPKLVRVFRAPSHRFPSTEFKQKRSLEAGLGRSSRRTPKLRTSLGASAHDIIHGKLNRHRAYPEPCTATHTPWRPLFSPLLATSPQSNRLDSLPVACPFSASFLRFHP